MQEQTAAAGGQIAQAERAWHEAEQRGHAARTELAQEQTARTAAAYAVRSAQVVLRTAEGDTAILAAHNVLTVAQALQERADARLQQAEGRVQVTRQQTIDAERRVAELRQQAISLRANQLPRAGAQIAVWEGRIREVEDLSARHQTALLEAQEMQARLEAVYQALTGETYTPPVVPSQAPAEPPAGTKPSRPAERALAMEVVADHLLNAGR